MVVDASEHNVKNGLTNPHEIERFFVKRVRCYTVANLHAKVYQADGTLFVGSANCSTHSRDTLLEACMSVRNAAALVEFESWLNTLALVPLTKERLGELAKLYRAPKWLKTLASTPRKASAWITWIDRDDDSDETVEYIEQVSAGHHIDEDAIYAISMAKRKSLSILAAQPGDEFFIIDHRERKAVDPPIRLIERPKLIGRHYRLAFEYPEEEPITFRSFLKAIRKVYPGFSDSGKSHRSISAAAAESIRCLWR